MSEDSKAQHQIVAEIISRLRDRRKSLVVGICGPQGSGKSTLAVSLREQLREKGLTSAVVSLDNFYLRRAARVELAASVHPLLRTRGVPGTHDIPLALQTLDALQASRASVLIPAFDKATDDLMPSEKWERVNCGVKVILLEGWCVGARAECDEALIAPINELGEKEDPGGIWRRYVNTCLASQYVTLFDRINYLMLLRAPHFDIVYHWRLQQEQELRRQVQDTQRRGEALMSPQDLRRFISHYERLTRHILAEMPLRADLTVSLDQHRSMRSIKVRC